MGHLDDLLIPPCISIREVMCCLERNTKGIALVVDPRRRLLGTVTDGDIRQAILTGINLDLQVQTLLDRPVSTPYDTPITALLNTSDAELLHMMNAYALRQIPLVDDTGRVVDLAILSELVKKYELPLTAVIMAGGYGTRLRPLTEQLPKPMLPVGNRPLLELIIEQLCRAGIRRVNLTTHYKGDIIAQHFGDGRNFGIEIRYVQEEQPLGTAGALGLIEDPDEPLLVMNGDILTRMDYCALLDFHRDHQADMTVAVRQYEMRLPYGVIQTRGNEIVGIAEKPTVQHFVNAGIYLLNPDMCRVIPSGQPYDMTDLIACLVAAHFRVISFPVCEYWQDIGQIEDYQKAVTAVSAGEMF
jgi:dTDP-glucose pyrophosphorylase